MFDNRLSDVNQLVANKVITEPWRYTLEDLAYYVSRILGKDESAFEGILRSIANGFNTGVNAHLREKLLARDRSKGYAWEKRLKTKSERKVEELEREVNKLKSGGGSVATTSAATVVSVSKEWSENNFFEAEEMGMTHLAEFFSKVNSKGQCNVEHVFKVVDVLMNKIKKQQCLLVEKTNKLNAIANMIGE